MADQVVAPEVKTETTDVKTSPVDNKTNSQPTATQDKDLVTLKVDGKEVKVTKEQYTALAQKGAFADKQLQSLAQLKKSTEGLINSLKTPEGLIQILKDPALGANPKEVFKRLMASDVIDDELKETMSRWVYDNVVSQARKTPEVIAAEKAAKELEMYKKQDADRKQQELSAKQQAQLQQIYEVVRGEISKQIVADKTFPQTEPAIKQVIEKVRIMNKQGVPITEAAIAKAMELVKKDHLNHQTALFDAIEDAEQLIKMVGEERALKISKAVVTRLKNKEKAASKETKKEEKVSSARTKKSDLLGHGYQEMSFPGEK